MAKTRLLVLSPIPEDVVRWLLAGRMSTTELEGVSVTSYEGTQKADLIRAVADADVIVGDYTGNAIADAEVLRAAKRCFFIQQPSVGFEHVDVETAAREGITVANVAGANTIAVAEHTIMLILACLKSLILSHEKTGRAEWAQDEMPRHGVFELWGKTLGIVGAGRIGKEVARRAKPFGVRIIYCSGHRLPLETEVELGMSRCGLDQLIAKSDIISIHTPLTPETENMINADRIAQMKPKAILINVSRGAIVDEAALAKALKEGRIHAAGLDVFAEEPVSPNNPLLDAPNVILTPHIAGATNESRIRIGDMFIDNVVRVLRGEAPVNIVNGVKPFTRANARANQ